MVSWNISSQRLLLNSFVVLLLSLLLLANQVDPSQSFVFTSTTVPKFSSKYNHPTNRKAHHHHDDDVGEYTTKNNNNDNDNGEEKRSKAAFFPSSSSASSSSSRRDVLNTFFKTASAVASITTSTMTVNPSPALAKLVQFPCPEGELLAKYHFMRAGESLLEEDNLWGTNPLFLTNRENALSDNGRTQVIENCQKLRDLKISQVKFSLAANVMDTAAILKDELLIPGNLVLPEYTYLDQRGLGEWDMFPLNTTQDAIWAMDALEAGKEGRGGVPPANNDGTPNESLYNQVTRLRQLISLSETYNSGDNVLFVFPDGTGPALLSCLIAGIPLNRVHELHFAPGEIRTDITYDSVRAMLPSEPTIEYLQAIQRGKIELERLRNRKSTIVSSTTSTSTSISTSNNSYKKQQQQPLQQQERKEMERLAREKRNENVVVPNNEQQSQQQQQLEESSSSSLASGAQSTVISLAGLAVPAALASFMPQRQNDNNKEENDKNDNNNSNIERQTSLLDISSSSTTATTTTTTTNANLFETRGENTEMNDTTTFVQRDDASMPSSSSSSTTATTTSFLELDVMEDLIKEGSFQIPEHASSTNNHSGRSSSRSTHANNNGLYNNNNNNNNGQNSLQQHQQLNNDNDDEYNTSEELLMMKEAEMAMNEYMNLDDGARAFDALMAELMAEDENDDDDDFEDSDVEPVEYSSSSRN